MASPEKTSADGRQTRPTNSHKFPPEQVYLGRRCGWQVNFPKEWRRGTDKRQGPGGDGPGKSTGANRSTQIGGGKRNRGGIGARHGIIGRTLEVLQQMRIELLNLLLDQQLILSDLINDTDLRIAADDFIQQ